MTDPQYYPRQGTAARAVAMRPRQVLKAIGALWLSRKGGLLRVEMNGTRRIVVLADGGICDPDELETIRRATQGATVEFDAHAFSQRGDRAALGRTLFAAAQQLILEGVDPLVSSSMTVRLDGAMVDALPLCSTMRDLLHATRGRLKGDIDQRVPGRAAVMADLGALVLLGAAEDNATDVALPSAPVRSAVPAMDDEVEWVVIPPGPGGVARAQDGLLQRARASIRRGEWAAARHLLLLAHEISPAHARVQGHLALALLMAPNRASDQAEARRLMRHAVRAAPDDPMVGALKVRLERLAAAPALSSPG